MFSHVGLRRRVRSRRSSNVCVHLCVGLSCPCASAGQRRCELPVGVGGGQFAGKVERRIPSSRNWRFDKREAGSTFEPSTQCVCSKRVSATPAAKIFQPVVLRRPPSSIFLQDTHTHTTNNWPVMVVAALARSLWLPTGRPKGDHLAEPLCLALSRGNDNNGNSSKAPRSPQSQPPPPAR